MLTLQPESEDDLGILLIRKPFTISKITIPDMTKRFNVLTGLIDNTTAVASIAIGVCVIEKHVTLDRNCGGPDDSFSLKPKKIEAPCRDLKTAWEALGRVDYQRKESEKRNIVFRRSLYVVKDMKKGEMITPDNVKGIRPGFGFPPNFYEMVIGAKAKENICRDTPLKLKLLEC